MTVIRSAAAEDAARLLEIYGYYVSDTAVSFEIDVPDAEEFCRRIEHTLERDPYLVAPPMPNPPPMPPNPPIPPPWRWGSRSVLSRVAFP